MDDKPYPKKCYLPFILYPPAMYNNTDGGAFVAKHINNDAPGDDFVLYVSIPFCRVHCKSCPYFVKGLTQNDPRNEEQRYVDALVKDIAHWASFRRWREGRLRAVYMGGGTGSILKTGNIKRVVDAIADNFNLTADYSFTLEGNAKDFDDEKMDYVAASKINRVSLGVQSFNEQVLRIVGSPHAADESIRVIRGLQARGMENIQMDLMYNIPEHSLEIWKSDLETLVDLKIPHFTIYLYRIHDDSPQKMLIQSGKVKPVEDPESPMVKAMYREALEIANRLGFEMYMVDHFAKPGHENMYNHWSWKVYTDALAIGPGAYSYFDGYRLGTSKDVESYIQHCERGEFMIDTVTPKMTPRNERERYIIFTLLYFCVDFKAYETRFGTSFVEDFADVVRKLLDKSLVVLTEDQMKLTKLGVEWHTNVILEFFNNDYWEDKEALNEPNWSMNIPMVQLGASSRAEWLGEI